MYSETFAAQHQVRSLTSPSLWEFHHLGLARSLAGDSMLVAVCSSSVYRYILNIHEQILHVLACWQHYVQLFFLVSTISVQSLNQLQAVAQL